MKIQASFEREHFFLVDFFATFSLLSEFSRAHIGKISDFHPSWDHFIPSVPALQTEEYEMVSIKASSLNTQH